MEIDLEKKLSQKENVGRDMGWKFRKFLAMLVKKTGFKIAIFMLGGLMLCAGFILSLFFRNEK